MGGRNTVLLDALSWRIPLVSDIPTIIFGADVTHPESGEDSCPSIAAVSIFQLSIYNSLTYALCLMYTDYYCNPGCSLPGLARSNKVCRVGLCSASPRRTHPRSFQMLERSTEGCSLWWYDQVLK